MSSSAWMASSEMSFSTRAISWIWKRTVSRFSNTNVTTGPTATRRRALSATTWRRNSGRSRLEARTSAMLSRVRLAVTAGSSGSNLFGDAIGPGDDLDGMERAPPGLLGDGRVGEMAVAGDHFAAEAGDLVPQLLA